MVSKNFVKSLIALSKTSEPGTELTDEEKALVAELAAKLPPPKKESEET